MYTQETLFGRPFVRTTARKKKTYDATKTPSAAYMQKLCNHVERSSGTTATPMIQIPAISPHRAPKRLSLMVSGERVNSWVKARENSPMAMAARIRAMMKSTIEGILDSPEMATV